MFHYFRSIFFLFLTLWLFSACENTALKDAEKEYLYNYLDENGIDVSPTESGLYFIPQPRSINQTEGPAVETGDEVVFHYTAYILEGMFLFETTLTAQPETLRIGQSAIIAGLEEGLLLMTEGQTATLLIPSELGFGSAQKGMVPPYSTLLFNVDLLDITNK